MKVLPEVGGTLWLGRKLDQGQLALALPAGRSEGDLRRVDELADTVSNGKPTMSDTDQVRAAILQARVNAALSGHDLGPLRLVDDGYQAACRRCGKTVWVGESGLLYSLLGESCGG